MLRTPLAAARRLATHRARRPSARRPRRLLADRASPRWPSGPASRVARTAPHWTKTTQGDRDDGSALVPGQVAVRQAAGSRMPTLKRARWANPPAPLSSSPGRAHRWRGSGGGARGRRGLSVQWSEPTAARRSGRATRTSTSVTSPIHNEDARAWEAAPTRGPPARSRRGAAPLDL